MAWLWFERRWRDALLAAMIPESSDGRPGLGALDQRAFHAEYDRVAPPLLRLGLRVSVWALTWSAVALHGRPFHRLPPPARDAFLRRAGRSRHYLVRQLVATLKVIACFAYFTDARVRERLESVS